MLNGWKEIANYLGRGVRTVQRYERECQLPVRRVHGPKRSHGSVLALTKDLDDWTRLRSLDSDLIEDHLRKGLLIEKHQKAISTLERSLLTLNERLAEGERIRMRQRWFGPQD